MGPRPSSHGDASAGAGSRALGERETFARARERDAPFSTISGEPLKPLYANADLPADPVKRGFPQHEIADGAFRYRQEVEAGVRKVVGVNVNTEGDEGEIPILRIDPEFEAQPVRRVRAAREKREPIAQPRRSKGSSGPHATRTRT